MTQLLVDDHAPVIVTGSTGRIGRILRCVWTRKPGPDIVWASRQLGLWPDLLHGLLTPCPRDAIILHLAADLSPGPAAAARSIAMAKAVAGAACRGQARHIFLASSAAVYGPSDKDLSEASECRPAGEYGRAKLLAEQVCKDAAGQVPMTVLRIGNVVGADALIGGARPGRKVWLDPVPGRSGGPLRSWIGPQGLARVLTTLVRLAQESQPLPPVLNLAAREPFAMADMLAAAGLDWDYGPTNPQTLARVTLDTSRLSKLVSHRLTTPDCLIRDWRRASGGVEVS